jgi:hypothetical protein
MIYIIAHNRVIFKDLYVDKSFDKSMYGVYITEGRKKNKTVTDNLIKSVHSEGLEMIHEWDLETYNPSLQNRTFLASTVLYHTHINEITGPHDYIGFLEYDLSLDLGEESFTYKVKEIVTKHKNEPFIIFPSIRHKLGVLNKQGNITCGGAHWLKFFFDDYNKRFGTSFKHADFVNKHPNDLIPTQQSFICDIETYKAISKYVYDFIEDHGNKSHSPRPSTTMERYIGMFMYLRSQKMDNVYKIPLKHKHGSGGSY